MIIAIASLLVVGATIWLGYRHRYLAAHPDGFLVASRSLGTWTLGAAVMASTLSGSLLLSGPGLQYRLGFSSMMLVIPAAASFGLVFYLLAGRLQAMGQAQQVRTIPQAIGLRFNSRRVRLLAATIIMLGAVGYLFVQTLLLAKVLAFALGLPMALAILLAVAATGAFHVLGGMSASVQAALFQAGLMAFAGVLIFVCAMVDGDGLANMTWTVAGEDAAFPGPFGDIGPGTVVGWYFVFCLGMSGQPQVINKFLMVRDRRQLRFAALIATAGTALAGLAWMGLGTWMRYASVNGDSEIVGSSEWQVLEFASSHMPVVVAAVFFAAAIAACMSTMSAWLGVVSGVIMYDVPASFQRRPLPEERMRAGRIGSGALLFAVALAAIIWGDAQRWFAVLGWSMLAAALVPTLALGLAWRRANSRAAALSILMGVTTAVLFEVAVFVPEVPDLLPGHVYPGAAALIVSTITFVFASLSEKSAAIAPDLNEILEGGNPAMRP